MKKFLTFVLVLAMVMSVSSFAMAAKENPCDDSPCGHMAAIGSTHYDTLKEAFEDATGNEAVTITLLKNATLAASNKYSLGGASTPSITIDGQDTYNFTIESSYMSQLDMVNPDGKLILKNIPKMTSTQASGTWDTYDLIFACKVEANNVGFGKSVALEKDAKLTNVTITETHDYYALWIEAKGQTVELNNVTIDSDGRGIKIDDQYVGSPEKVTLIVNDGSVESANKAAIMVKSAAGAEVTIDNLDISKVAADSKAAVWVDEDAAATVNDVITNAYKKVEDKEMVVPPYGKVEGDTVSTPVARIGNTPYYTLQEALKALTDGDTLTLLDDVTITEDWDARNHSSTADYATITESGVTIDGNGKTIKFTGKMIDPNRFEAFRFEAAVTVKNLTIDMSKATSIDPKRMRAISTNSSLTVDGCTFIGNPDYTNSRAIIFGEGAGTNVGNLEIKITNSTFKDWRYGIRDNENGQDVKSVEISGNEFDNAGVNVCAKESITFTNNTLDNSAALLHSYTNRVAGSTEKGKPDSLTVTGNTIDGKTANTVDENGNLVEDPAPSQSPEINPTTSSGNGISVTYNGGNSFSTSNPAVPTSVEIDGVPVTFNGNGSNFTVGCISSDAKWVTIRWNSTTVTTNFTPDGLVECTTVSIPKTGDMSIWAAIAAFFGF